eukprot:CAMPEP_0197525706 /NCGR_PEP_ID=MMETSP1318-20131121/13996_1 /TAXON_ID=552666 /ORGANISM="Partenskyella glossopodia, Strain RCC365" /LENGTH=240 /DNA_ID=CAMNT_0043079399 /DNA_START=57 /DNA_END=779 /DNA_ORIENTATION=+
MSDDARAYTTFDINTCKRLEIEDRDALQFWSKNFEEATTISTTDFADRMLKKFSDDHKKVVSVLCKHVICCSGDANKKEVSAEEFDKFIRRFGPFNDCIRNAKQVFFHEKKSKNGEVEYELVKWYHGFLEDSKSKILGNPGKFLVREPKEKRKWHLLTVEYSKTFEKDGKKLLARNKKHLIINRKKNLFVWTKKDGKKTGHPSIEVALNEMASGREPINSDMWTAVENQSLYQAASYDYD